MCAAPQGHQGGRCYKEVGGSVVLYHLNICTLILQKLNPKLYITGSLFHHLIFKILFSHLFQTTEEGKDTRPLTVSFF